MLVIGSKLTYFIKLYYWCTACGRMAACGCAHV